MALTDGRPADGRVGTVVLGLTTPEGVRRGGSTNPPASHGRAVVDIGLARMLGDPVPSNHSGDATTVAVPWAL